MPTPTPRELNLFSRRVPTVKQIGLLGPCVRQAYAAMGVLRLAEVDADSLRHDDEPVATTFDHRPGRRPGD